MSAKVTPVKFKKETLNLINDLAAINNQIVIGKDEKDKNAVIKSANPAETLAYIFTTKKDNFSFDGDELAFYKFSEFYQMLSCFAEPTINQNLNKLVISEKTAKLNYLLTDASIIQKGPSSIKFVNPDYSIKIEKAGLAELEKMVGLLETENVSISIKKNSAKATIKLFNSDHNNSFEKSFTLDEKNGQEDFEIKFSAEIFRYAPKEDYTVDIKKEGILRFAFENENANVQLFTAELED